MELRHLRYFIAVAEEGSLTVAAEKRLHTAQPSLSRQIRDLEQEIGVPLLKRSVHGVELTAAGRVFLDHARLALTQAEAAPKPHAAPPSRASRCSRWVLPPARRPNGCRARRVFCATSSPLSKSGFRATTQRHWPTSCRTADSMSPSCAQKRCPTSNSRSWRKSRCWRSCLATTSSRSARPSIPGTSPAKPISGYPGCRACCAA